MIYIAFQYVDLVGLYSSHGPGLGWVFAGQDGGDITMFSPNRKMRLGVIVDVETRFFTQLDYRLDEPPSEDDPK